jgi:hypothetical protein
MLLLPWRAWASRSATRPPQTHKKAEEGCLEAGKQGEPRRTVSQELPEGGEDDDDGSVGGGATTSIAGREVPP